MNTAYLTLNTELGWPGARKTVHKRYHAAGGGAEIKETKTLGAYLPTQVTTEGRVWLEGAFTGGPTLLMGLHNWANLFSKNKLQNGGFYLAIVIKPGKGWKIREEKKYTCPH